MLAPPMLLRALIAHDPALNALPAAHRAAMLEAATEPQTAQTVSVIGAPDGVPVRAAPSADAPAIGVLRSGERATLARPAAENGYYCVLHHDAQGFATAAALAPAAAAPLSLELSAGTYKATSSAPLRVSPSTTAAEHSRLQVGERVRATGDNDNGFARVETLDRELNDSGWASAAALEPEAPAAASTVTTQADAIALRAMLAAWANATPNAPVYGSPADLDDTPAAAAREADVLRAFQASQGLPETGVADAPTRDALIAWARARAASLAGGALAPLPASSAPSSTTTTTAPTPARAPAHKPADAPNKWTPILIIAAVAAGAWFVLEERKKSRAQEPAK